MEKFAKLLQLEYSRDRNSFTFNERLRGKKGKTYIQLTKSLHSKNLAKKDDKIIAKKVKQTLEIQKEREFLQNFFHPQFCFNFKAHLEINKEKKENKAKRFLKI